MCLEHSLLFLQLELTNPPLKVSFIYEFKRVKYIVTAFTVEMCCITIATLTRRYIQVK